MCGWKLSMRAARFSGKNPLRDRDGVRRDIERPPTGRAHEVKHLSMLRLLALRIEVDAELDMVRDLFARPRVVDVEHDLRIRQHQLAATRPHQLALLADGPFHEQTGVVQRIVVVGGRIVLQQGVGLLLLQAARSRDG